MQGKKYTRTRKRSSYISKGTGSKIVNTGKGSIAKKRSSRRRTKVNLERETRKLVSKVNARLDSLQRRYKSGTWASKKLANRLSSNKINMWSKQGKIKLGKNPTKVQMIGLNKAINQFLRSQTSTKRGIQKVKRKQIESIRLRRSVEDKEFTEEDAEDFYDMFGDNDFAYFADKIGASKLQEIVYDAIRANDSEDNFLDRLALYIELNDLDIREKAIRLYNKYVA